MNLARAGGSLQSAQGADTIAAAGLAFGGSCPATLAGIPETPHPTPGPNCDRGESPQREDRLVPRPGWYALSVNYLYSRACQYRRFREFDPVAMAGYSIYIYQITLDEANPGYGGD